MKSLCTFAKARGRSEMQYVSQVELDAFSKVKRNEGKSALRTAAVSHQREVEKRGFFYFWVQVLVVANNALT